jgi:hypothetical protein
LDQPVSRIDRVIAARFLAGSIDQARGATGGTMKRLLTAGLALLLVAGASRLYVAAEPEQSATAGGFTLWQTGRCYRVFPSDPDAFHLFKVMDIPIAGWVRVQTQPVLPPAPGVPPPAALWLNTNSPFAVQEWPCS